MEHRIKEECFITNDLTKSVQCHQQQQKVKNNANIFFVKLQQRVALKMKTSSKTKIANAMEGDSIGMMN